ncbi:MAG: ribosomal protein S18-alanine N-acetyltransferase [Lachnospiraceae bacterium]|nr:ribosomal protein S18-alanine N-acetyltransferase [Lachnospiraceae bacterium]
MERILKEMNLQMKEHPQEREQMIEEIYKIEQCTFPDPWSEKSIADTLSVSGYRNTAVWIDGELAGYLFCSHVLDEAEIVKIAVHPKFQRQGVARMLLEEFLEWCKDHDISRWMLDVRAGNVGAIALYRAFGFVEDGVRKNYYEHPREDALLMSRSVSR